MTQGTWPRGMRSRLRCFTYIKTDSKRPSGLRFDGRCFDVYVVVLEEGVSELGILAQDFRFEFRRLKNSPRFSIVAVLTLDAGSGTKRAFRKTVRLCFESGRKSCRPGVTQPSV